MPIILLVILEIVVGPNVNGDGSVAIKSRLYGRFTLSQGIEHAYSNARTVKVVSTSSGLSEKNKKQNENENKLGRLLCLIL